MPTQELFSQMYDNELYLAKRIKVEAILAKSEFYSEIANESYFDFYTISKSIKRVVNKLFIQH